MAANDTTSAIPSPAEPVVDRYRRWTSIWYPWIKRVLETVRRTEADLFTVSTTVDEVSGKWGVDISENGRVRGSVKLDASSTLTEFAVLADKFIVVHPTVDATEIQAFIVGNVNGVSTVGINGDLLVDGTIVARHLNVSTLSAVTANMGTITAGKMQSSDGLMVVDLDKKIIRIEA